MTARESAGTQPDSPAEFPARWQRGGQLYSDYIRRTAVQVSKEGEDVRTRERAMGLPELLETGQQLDHFRIDEPIAESGMAAIYRATDMRDRSEERRVGKECRSRWSPYH